MKLFENGSTWVRADFHLHTKADREFYYEGLDEEFSDKWSTALKDSGVSIGVVTNHNKFVRDEFMRLKKVCKDKEVILHAGVELSVKEGKGCHTLICFSEEWYENTDYINRFLDLCFGTIADNRESENQQCERDLPYVLELLHSEAGKGRDSFIIFAHIDDNSGICKSVSGSRVQQMIQSHLDLWDQYVVGLQKQSTRTWSQWMSEIRGKELALVEGSDCKSIHEVGRMHGNEGNQRATFVKVGTSAFRSLKFALQFHSYRVQRNRLIEREGSKIESIIFESSKLNQTTIKFNEALNILIGKPGSGKSSMIETLRFLLEPDRQLDLAKLQGHMKYKCGTVRNLLGDGGNVGLTYKDTKGNLRKFWRSTAGQYFVEDENSNRVLSDFQESIRVVAFGQKDLTFNVRDELYNKFFLTFFSNLLADNTGQLDKISKRYAECTTSLMDSFAAPDNLVLRKKQLAEVNSELDTFKKHNVEGRLSLMKKLMDARAQTEELLTGLPSQLKPHFEAILAALSLPPCFSDQEVDFVLQQDISLRELEALFGKAKQSIQTLEEIFFSSTHGFVHLLSNASDAVSSEQLTRKREFDAILSELGELIDVPAYLRKQSSRDSLVSQIEELTALSDSRQLRLTELKSVCEDYDTCLEDRRRVISEFAASVKSTSKLVTLQVLNVLDREAVLKLYRDFFRGTTIRDEKYVKYRSKYATPYRLVLDFFEFGEDSELFSDLESANQKAKLTEFMRSKANTMVTEIIPPELELLYDGKSLSIQSDGERASALILFTLASNNYDLLIIDQPEDDLNSEIINDEFVRHILGAKSNTQFVFATHNPNIAVLADSDNLFSTSYFDGRLSIVSASIDTHEARENIVNLMEGGQQAFDLRNKIYRSWKMINRN